MTSRSENLVGNRMITEMGDFITRHLNDVRAGWPVRTVMSDDSEQRPRMSGEANGMRVLLVGELAIEFPIEVEAGP